MTSDAFELLRIYDEQPGLVPEFTGAVNETCQGSLRLVEYTESRGVVTYKDLNGADAEAIRRLIAGVKAFFEAKAGIRTVRWKPRASSCAGPS